MQNYTVQSGDTLGQIAQRNGVTLQQLLAMNPQFQANPNLIRPGQTVNLSAVSASPSQITPSTIETLTKQVNQLAATDPVLAPLASKNTAEAITNAYLSGDFSGVTDSFGNPFSEADQQAAFSKAQAELEPYYSAQKDYETKATEDALKQKQLDYQQYLATAKTNFETEKSQQDQTSANQGVLFSGGRAQREQNLQNTYDTANAYKKASIGADIGSTARDFQYKYGDNAAGNLSQYYNLGGNTYNANVATGGVTPQGLSSVYSPSTSNYQGTTINTAKAEAQKRAAGLLANRSNKLFATGYKKQF